MFFDCFIQKSDYLYQFFAAMNILAFMFGIWGFNIINSALSPLLRSKWKRYIVSINTFEFIYFLRTLINFIFISYIIIQLRTKVLSAFVVILKLQNFILGILYFANVIPCIVPYVSPAIMRKSKLNYNIFLKTKKNSLKIILPR